MPIEADDLLKEIRAAFPQVQMPTKRDLRFHPEDCFQCEHLSEYLDESRGKPVDGAIIRYMHQEMSCLSAKGWLWALPHYLPFCLTPEAEYNRMETEFLIYNLGPGDKYADDTKVRLSALAAPQVRCLVHFLEWLSVNPKWKDYCPEDLSRALQFVRGLSV
jgi:hypothetical protein